MRYLIILLLFTSCYTASVHNTNTSIGYNKRVLSKRQAKKMRSDSVTVDILKGDKVIELDRE